MFPLERPFKTDTQLSANLISIKPLEENKEQSGWNLQSWTWQGFKGNVHNGMGLVPGIQSDEVLILQMENRCSPFTAKWMRYTSAASVAYVIQSDNHLRSMMQWYWIGSDDKKNYRLMPVQKCQEKNYKQLLT